MFQLEKPCGSSFLFGEMPLIGVWQPFFTVLVGGDSPS